VGIRETTEKLGETYFSWECLGWARMFFANKLVCNEVVGARKPCQRIMGRNGITWDVVGPL